MKNCIYGSLELGIFNINNSENYYEDDNIFIAVDSTLKVDFLKIKELYYKSLMSDIGDFISIYLYDKVAKKLLLVPDRMGVKPIYYSEEGNSIYFGGDTISIVDSFNLKKDINVEVLPMFFRHHYIVAPNTIFKEVKRIEHGSYLQYENNKLQLIKYWDLYAKYNEGHKNLLRNYEECKNGLHSLLENTVNNEIDLLGEGNLGFYISGGIDSSLVSALATKYIKKPITTISIGFDTKNEDESIYAKEVANLIGSSHKEYIVTDKDALEFVHKVPLYYREPFADASQVVTIILNEFAKENGISVAITGDGADQLFCGLNEYDYIKKTQILHDVGNPFNLHIDNSTIHKHSKLEKMFFNTDKRYQSQFNVYRYETGNHLDNLLLVSGKTRYEEEQLIKTSNWQERRMILDLGTFIRYGVVNKMSRATYFNNIEMMSPFLDKEVIEYSFSIPHKYKYYKGDKKHILKEVLYEYLPSELFNRKKHGFGIPKWHWLETCLKQDLIEVSDRDFIISQGIFNPDYVEKELKSLGRVDTQVVWAFLMFQLWYKTYIV